MHVYFLVCQAFVYSRNHNYFNYTFIWLGIKGCLWWQLTRERWSQLLYVVIVPKNAMETTFFTISAIKLTTFLAKIYLMIVCQPSPFPPTFIGVCRAWIGFQYTYKQGLGRMSKARENGFQYLKVCIQQESKFVPQDAYLVQEFVTDFLEVGKISLIILQKCALDNTFPYQVESRNVGSCPFDAVSVLLTGDKSLSSELRLKTFIEMRKNQNLYENRPKLISFMICSPIFERACLDCASYWGWSPIWIMLALSNVIGKNINSIYPPMNGKANRVYKTLHFVIRAEVPSEKTLTYRQNSQYTRKELGLLIILSLWWHQKR